MSHIQTVSASTSSITSHQLTMTGVQAGSFLIACIRSSTLLNNITGVSDDKNGAWTQLGSFVDTASRRCAIYYTANSAAGTLTITGTSSGTAVWRWSASEYGNVSVTSPIDTYSFTTYTTTTTPTTASITTTQPNETLVAFIALDNAISTIVPAGGETERVEVDALFQVQDKAASSSGAYTSSWTLNSSQPGAYAIVALKSPTASPAPNVGSVVMSGQVPVLVKQRTVLPAVGSVSIQGKVPVTTPGQLQPAQSALTLTGPAPTIIQQTGPNAGVGTAILVFNGLAPTLVLSRTIQPQLITSDAVTNGALAPTVLTQWTSKSSTAALSVSGKVPNLIKDGSTRISPDPALLTLTGLAVTSTVPFNGILSPNRAGLDCLGLVPEVIGNWILSPAHDSDADILAITGLAPTLRGRLNWHDSARPSSATWRIA